MRKNTFFTKKIHARLHIREKSCTFVRFFVEGNVCLRKNGNLAFWEKGNLAFEKHI